MRPQTSATIETCRGVVVVLTETAEARRPAAVPRGAPEATATLTWPAKVVTAVIVFAPLGALVYAVWRLWGTQVSGLDLALAIGLYLVVGHGVTVGFHRLFTHRSFRAARPVKLALAIAGSMAYEGALLGWVAEHRRHHAFTDRAGDPHSPNGHGSGVGGMLRGLWHAHVGWLFANTSPASRQRYAHDLLRDRDLVMVDRLFPLWCALSLALPFGFGWALTGQLSAGVSALLWGGAVRIFVLHHVTWSINSLCHVFGRRPYRTGDRSTNLAALAVLSMGESWHNSHHAFPDAARHGGDRHQLDSSAAVIDVLAWVGWADRVRVVSPSRRADRRLATARG
jgi:stearoyl-CoA desaturase (delta-9 desaturase)